MRRTSLSLLVLSCALGTACSSSSEPTSSQTGSSGAALVNGQPASADGVGVVYITTDKFPAPGGCTGVLMTNYSVLTAAHCFDGNDVSNPGGISVTTPTTATYGTSVINNNPGGANNGWSDPDIALVQLNDPIAVGGSFNFARTMNADPIMDQSLNPHSITCFGDGYSDAVNGTVGVGTLRMGDFTATAVPTDANGNQPPMMTLTSSTYAVAHGDSGGPCLNYDPLQGNNAYNPSLVGIIMGCYSAGTTGCPDPTVGVMVVPNTGNNDVYFSWVNNNVQNSGQIGVQKDAGGPAPDGGAGTPPKGGGCEVGPARHGGGSLFGAVALALVGLLRRRRRE